MLAKTFLLLLLLPYVISTQPIELTDKTWKNMVTGEWMVEFYATWCSACQHFKPIWSDFSNAVSSKNVKVAAVDIEQYPSLSGRFHVSSLPTIYYVRDGAFRVYDGERSLNALKNYIAHEDWKKTEPMSPYSAPDSFLMSLNSVAFDLSEILRSAYTLLHEQYGWPTWLIYILLGIAIILVGALIGFVTVVIVDSVMAVISKIFSRADGKNKKGLVEIDAEKLLKSKKQENSTDTSPTAQQTKDEKESSESDESDGSDDKLNTSDVVQEKDEQEEQTTTDQTVRQRRLEK
ncbi:unnamed protein product [Rotaria sp. Silwood2]|nr:unnamed protein product [Rotaria sp. Silwood2]CAF2821703.1 unnamed protein product [Rotaria sp. Silwood2]CAF3159775.1 unnamed protein product [Rotaria sp. Silwood2]